MAHQDDETGSDSEDVIQSVTAIDRRPHLWIKLPNVFKKKKGNDEVDADLDVS